MGAKEKIPVSERTEMKGKVIGDGLEEGLGRQARQGLKGVLRIWVPATEGQCMSSPESVPIGPLAD